ncbi:restriction endonuclease subunit S [Escherichia coli]|uniref:restriction endonuclease subunit S n=1 Tax=Escherichia coli TaxID=562 RepID=UPI0023F65E6F|nr:restriction endonuclease subunit S [Escherichia coli]MDF7534395.1 restriction endonuclease subunit S [Escherichia coli]
MVPKGWRFCKLADISRVTSGGTPNRAISEYWQNGTIPWIRTTEVQNCILQPEDAKEYISELGLRKSSAKLIPENTILLAMIGQGKTRGQIALLKFEAAINQNCAAIIFGKSQEPEFYYHYLLSQYENIRNLSNSAGQSNLSGALVKAINVLVPPYNEQKKIAQILSTWDKAISVTEKLLTNSQQQKKALMQQLLTGKKRLLDERGGRYGGEWHRAELGAVLDYMQPTPYLVDSTDYNDSYSIPVLTAGKSFILGYTNEEHGIYHAPLPAIIFDDFTTNSKFVDFEFKAKSSAMKILTAKKGVSAKYIFEAMQMLKFKIGGHQRHWISIYSNLVIPIPDAKEQQKIAAVLSAADAEISTLEKKLACLRDEKKALMQQLLTGKRRVKVDEAVAE